MPKKGNKIVPAGTKGVDALTADEIKQIEKLASLGLTQDQIVKALPISRSKFYELKQIQPDIMDAIGRGKVKGLSSVSNALFNSAMTGDVSAQKFYLQSQAPSQFNPASNVNLSGSANISFNMNFTGSKP